MNDTFTLPAAQAYAYPLLIKHLWASPLAFAADQEIVYRDQRRQTYRQTLSRITQLANVLASTGIREGDTVGVLDWDSHRYLECLYAVPMMGAVLLTVNVRLSPEQILYTLNHARPEVLLVHEDFASILDEIRPSLLCGQKIIWISDTQSAPPASWATAGEYEALVRNASRSFDFPDIDENSRATTFYTTGTTGNPKGVFFSHRQLVLHTLSGMAALASPSSGQRFHRGDVYMPVTPMFHVHAWGMPYIALQLGVKQVYPGRYEPTSLVRMIEREGVTFSHCVPTLLQMILDASRTEGIDLGRWKVVIGGSALSEGLARAALERGIDIFAGYGMSETCPLLTLSQSAQPDSFGAGDGAIQNRCKAGTPIPLVYVRTVDEDMNDLPADGASSGEIVVRAPWLTQGYLGNAEASDSLWQGGFLHTQDIGVLDRGLLKITDRLKDVIKTGGEWVSSLEIEDLMSKHPSVKEVAVVGIKDSRWGERPLAFVALHEGAQADEEGLRKHLQVFCDNGLIAKYAIPARCLFVPSLARTSVGKIDKKKLRAVYASTDALPASS